MLTLFKPEVEGKPSFRFPAYREKREGNPEGTGTTDIGGVLNLILVQSDVLILIPDLLTYPRGKLSAFCSEGALGD